MVDKNIEKIIEEYQSGNKDYLNDIYKYAFRIAYNEAYEFFHNEQQAEDVAQDTMIKAFEKIDSLKDAKAFNKWINTIARNICIDIYKVKNNRLNINSAKFSDLYDEENDLEFDPEDEKETIKLENSLPDGIRKEILDEVIGNLNDDQKVITIMHFYEGLTLKTIAEELDLDMSTVTGRFRLAKINIKTEVETIQKRENLKLYNISGLPAIPLFIYLLGRYEEADTSIKYVASEQIIKRSLANFSKSNIDKIVPKTIKSSTINATKTTIGTSTGFKAVAGIALAVAVVGGGYIVSKNLNEANNNNISNVEVETTQEPPIETYDYQGLSFDIPEGWTVEIRNLVDSNNTFGESREEKKVIYICSGNDLSKDPYIIISSFEINNIGLGNIGPEEEGAEYFYDGITAGNNKYTAYYGSYLVGTDLYGYGFRDEYFYGMQWISDGSSTWDVGFGQTGMNPGIHFYINYFSHKGNSINDEGLQTVLRTLKLNKIGYLSMNGNSIDEWGNVPVVKIENESNIEQLYLVLTSATYDVYEVKELNGHKYYRVGWVSWISDEYANFSSNE